MDKNNDIQVNKVNKWEAAPVSIKNLRNYILESWKNYAAPRYCPPLDPLVMMQLLEPVLDDYNELEAKHQKDTGMISEYEEENRDLKSELDIKTDECDDLISRVFKQDEEYTKLEAESEELRSKCETQEDALRKVIQEVTELEKEKIELENRLTQEKRKDTYVILRNHNTIYDLKAEIRGLESELKQVIELAKSYGIIIHDERKDAKPDNAINIGMCGYYYVLDEKLKEINKSCPVACECENFKPKVHHSYDPLDDLPDVEHS